MIDPLWTQFRHPESQELGGGLLYCLRYEGDVIKEQRDRIARVLSSELEMEVSDLGDQVGVSTRTVLSDSQQRRAHALLEELSTLNDAVVYASKGLARFADASQLVSGLKCEYYIALMAGRIVDAYDLVTITMPRLARELLFADAQNGVLQEYERAALSDLLEFAGRGTRFLNRPGDTVIFGKYL